MSIFDEEHVARAYYHVKPFLPRRAQVFIRALVARAKRRLCRGVWPIDPAAAGHPAGWGGWPRSSEFAVVLTHDVDTARGLARCRELMRLEREAGFVSSFNLVAEGYQIPPQLRADLEEHGFEVGVHGIEHSRKMYESHITFALHAARINSYLKEWGAVGFRSPCMYHNFDWLRRLHILYDASSFDTDPFEPQSDGVKSIFPLSVAGDQAGQTYVELPYTLPQDFTLFVLLKEKGIEVWKEKLRWVAARGGMALVLTHPDYMCFSGSPRFEEYPVEYYRDFLLHIQAEYRGRYWQPLPRELATFWANRLLRGEAVGTGPRPSTGIAVAETGAVASVFQQG